MAAPRAKDVSGLALRLGRDLVRTARQLPAGPDEVARIAVGVALEVVLVLGLGFPEIAGGRDFGHDLAGPQPRRVDVGDRVLGDALLLMARVEDRGAVARSRVVALAIARARVVNLEKELEELPVGDSCGIEEDLDGFGVRPVIAIGRVAYVATAIPDARRQD